MNSSDETIIKNLINSENKLMCQLDRCKSDKIKEVQEIKHTEKGFKYAEGMNKESPTQMEIGGAKKYDNADTPRQVWDGRVFIHFLHVEDFTLYIKRNVVENI